MPPRRERDPLTPEQQALLTANVGLAHLIALEVYQQCRTLYAGESEDLVQAALVHMAEVAAIYDPAHGSGASFATYVAAGIRWRLRYLVRTHGFGGRMPGNKVRKGKPRKALSMAAGPARRRMSRQATERFLGVCRNTAMPPLSLSLPVCEGSERDIGDIGSALPDLSEPPPLDADERELLARAVNRLTPERAWLVRRYYLDDPALNARELGEMLGISHQSVLYRLQTCLRHLRDDPEVQRAWGHD